MNYVMVSVSAVIFNIPFAFNFSVKMSLNDLFAFPKINKIK